MKIGLVLPLAPGYSETFLKSKIGSLQDSGNQVFLFCGADSQNFNQCPVFLFPKHYKNGLKQIVMLFWVYLSLTPYLKHVYRFIILERKDNRLWIEIFKHIYVYSPVLKKKLHWLHFGFGTLAIGAENLAAAKQAKMAVSYRGFDIGVYPIKHPNCYQKLWEKVSKIHVISDDIAQLVYQQGFKNQVPLVKITPAINTSYFETSEQQFESDVVKIVTIARLHWKKGLNYTLEALSVLKQKGINFEYTIIGAGPEEEALKFAAYQLGLQPQVVFLGKLKPEAVKQQLSNSQIYIQYSVQEGFCNAVLEAQAMGLLCVVSDAEGLAENVLDGQTGWVVKKRMPSLLAEKIHSILKMTVVEQQKISRNSRNRVREQFNLEKQQNEFLQFYAD